MKGIWYLLQLAKALPGNNQLVIGRAQLEAPELPLVLARDQMAAVELEHRRGRRLPHALDQVLRLSMYCKPAKQNSDMHTRQRPNFTHRVS